MTEPGYDLIPTDRGQLQIRAGLPEQTPAVQNSGRCEVIGATATFIVDIDVTLDEILGASDYLRSLVEGRCTAVRDLFAGTTDAGTVIQLCDLAHHMDVHAHLMHNPDGSVTTWRH